MDATMYNSNPYIQQQQMMGQNPYYAYQPQMFRPTIMPQNQNALNNEEIQILKNRAGSGTDFDLNIDQEEYLESMCTHKDNGRDAVLMTNDGTGDVFCPICKQRWNPEAKSEQEITDLTKQLLDQMQIAKWIGEFPNGVAREFFPIMPLIKRFPKMASYAGKNFNKYYNQPGMFSASDANVYANYDATFGPGFTYQQPMMNQGYYQQPTMGQYNSMMANQGMMNQGYYQQPMQPGQQANPYVNPMQANPYAQQPMNTQFTDQANMMMGGTMYQPGPNNNGMAYAPVFNTAQQPTMQQPQQQNTQQPVQQPQQQQQKTATSENKIEL